MLKSGGVVIPMLQILSKVSFLVGSVNTVSQMKEVPGRKPFNDEVIEFLDDVSKKLMKDVRSKAFPDVISFGFWIRKGSTLKLKEKYKKNSGDIILGRGVAFHIAPSNVPVNFAYSMASGLLTGNANIVRVPSKRFEQIDIITEALNSALDDKPEMAPYIALVRYERDKEINDLFSSMADTRIIWGGDRTIEEIRQSPLPPRSSDVTFADRYSIALINSDEYLFVENKRKVASDFYNDTFFSDQNACTSPRVVIWTGSKKEEAKELFWEELHNLVREKYEFQPIQGVNKLTSSYMMAVLMHGVKIVDHKDNYIIRVAVPKLSKEMMELKDNSGYFFEYDCEDVLELEPLCNDKRCQTIGLLGDKDYLIPLLSRGIKGVDRVVPIGKTMDFDLVWDGYDLPSQLTRTITI